MSDDDLPKYEPSDDDMQTSDEDEYINNDNDFDAKIQDLFASFTSFTSNYTEFDFYTLHFNIDIRKNLYSALEINIHVNWLSGDIEDGDDNYYTALEYLSKILIASDIYILPTLYKQLGKFKRTLLIEAKHDDNICLRDCFTSYFNNRKMMKIYKHEGYYPCQNYTNDFHDEISMIINFDSISNYPTHCKKSNIQIHDVLPDYKYND